MVVAASFEPHAPALAALAADHGAAIGLHVTLTAPYRPLTGSFAPLPTGAFLSVEKTLLASLWRQFDRRALAAEVESQFAAFEHAFGHAPDFVDGHQHVHLFPQIRDAVLAVTKARAPAAWVRQCGRARLSARQFGDPKGFLIDALSRGFRRRAGALGLATNPAFAGTYTFGPRANFARLFPRFLDGLPDGGLVMCHPGHVDAELERLDPLTDMREREFAYLAGDQFPHDLAAAAVGLMRAPASAPKRL
jgi:predicted glycoside hydrolase/deacetylase ChbG (UPF0249 family)